MKHKWLYALLVLSLAVNAGALGFYAVKQYNDWRHFRDYQGKLFKPGIKRGQIARLFSDLDRSRKPWFDTLRLGTKDLGELAEQPNPDSERVNAALSRIARAEREQLRLRHENMRELLRLNAPQQVELFRKMVEAYRDSILRAESAAVAEPQEPR